MKRTFVALFTLLLMAFMTGCAPVRLQSRPVDVSPRSPFYSERILLDKPDSSTVVAQKTEANDSTEEQKPASMELTLLIDNKCATKYCTDMSTHDQLDSISCPLLLSDKHPLLAESQQAYDWKLENILSKNEIESKIQNYMVDNFCIVGVANTRRYQSKQVSNTGSGGSTPPTTPAAPLGQKAGPDSDLAKQYYHDVINGTKAYSFFENEKLEPVQVAVIDTGSDQTFYDQTSPTYSYVVTDGHPDLLFPTYNDARTETNPSYVNSVNGVFSKACKTKICHWHGTFVAGIIAARANNSIGGRGIAKNASISSVRIGDENGTYTSTELANALNFIANSYYKVEIVNMSLGGGDMSDFASYDAMVKVSDKNILIVTSAGNDSKDLNTRVQYPASFNLDGQITVGAASPDVVTSGSPGPYNLTNVKLRRDPYSNYGDSTVSIAAPGTGIYSTVLNKGYSVSDGTSFAAPMVTAAAALARGYLKANGINPTSNVLKELLLKGTRSLPELREKNAAGVEFSPFENDRFLDLDVLKSVLAQYVKDFSTSIPHIDLVASSAVESGGSKKLHLDLQVRNYDPGANLTLKVYSNKNFLNDSFTGAQCELGNKSTCSFDIDFTKFLVDNSVYILVLDSTGKLISDLLIPFDQLNLGSRKDAKLDGEVIAVWRDSRDNTIIEGWACLVGFPDTLDIKASRKYTYYSTNTLEYTAKTDIAARGNYFSRCKSPSITHGFRISIPKYSYGDGEVSISATHPDVSLAKTLALPVLSYQPGYNDNTPLESRSVVPSFSSYPNPATLKITKKKFKNWNLELEGTVCVSKDTSGFYQHKGSAAFSINLQTSANKITIGDALSVVPEYWDNFGVSRSLATTVNAATVAYKGRDLMLGNPGVRINDKAGRIGCGGGFNEIYTACATMTEAGGQTTLVLLGPSLDFGAGVVGTFTPSTQKDPNCAHPDGFSVSINVKPLLNSYIAGVGVSYREDMYASWEAALNAAGLQSMLPILTNPVNRNFDQLRFMARAFNPTVNVVDSDSPISLYSPFSTFWSRLYGVPNLNDWYGISSYQKEIYNNLDPSVFVSTNVTLTSGTATDLSVVYTSQEWTLPVESTDRLYAALAFDQGTRFGELGKDFKLEARFNGGSTWYDLPIDLLYQTKANDKTYNGIIGADADLPLDVTKVQLRIRANQKNAMIIKYVGIGAP